MAGQINNILGIVTAIVIIAATLSALAGMARAAQGRFGLKALSRIAFSAWQDEVVVGRRDAVQPQQWLTGPIFYLHIRSIPSRRLPQ